MIRITIDEKLEEMGKTRYWLAKQTGMTYPNICNLASGKTTGILFEKLDKICDAMDCAPGDIITKA